jgi:hypothetical protein
MGSGAVISCTSFSNLLASFEIKNFSAFYFANCKAANQASAMKKSELDLHKMLWFKDTIQVR